MLELAPDPLLVLQNIKRDKLDRGSDLIDLSMINPDLPPPRFLMDKLMEATAKPMHHRYAVSRGVRKLRLAFSEKYRNSFGVNIDPESEVCATMGSKDALSVLLRLMRGNQQSSTNDPIRILVGAPTYPGFIAPLKLLGCDVEYFEIVSDTEQMARSITEALQTRRHQLLILNFPNNPTGITVNAKFYQSVISAAQGVGAVVYNDFVYGELEYNSPAAVSLLCHGVSSGLIESYSISKAYSAPGWRVAALLGDSKIISLASRLKSIRDYGIFLPLQLASAAALSSKEDLARNARDIYRTRARLMSSVVKDLGWYCESANSGASIWVRTTSIPELRSEASSFEVAEAILKERGVFCLPGQVCGERFSEYLRFALVCSEERIREVSRRFAKLDLSKLIQPLQNGVVSTGATLLLCAFLNLYSPIKDACAQTAPEAKSTEAAEKEQIPADTGKSDCAAAGKLVRQGVLLGDGSPEEERIYRDAIGKCPQMPEAYLDLAIVLARTKRDDEAITSFRKALELRDDANFRVALGGFYLEREKLKESQAEYEKAISLEPNSVRALQGLSVVLEKSGNVDQAVETLENAIKIEPNNPLTLFNLAAITDKRGDTDAAIANYEKVIAVDANHFEALFYLGLVYRKVGRVDDAVRVLEAAAKVNSESAPTYQALGVVYDRRGDLEKAESAFRKAIALDPGDVSSMVNLGLVLINKKQEDLAREVLERAVRNDPKNSRALSALGWGHLQLGQYKEAEAALLHSLEIDAMNASTHNNLGVLYQRTGRIADAKREFKTAVRLDPNLESAHRNVDRFGSE